MGDRNSTVVLFSLKERKWIVNRITPLNEQVQQSLELVANDVGKMESILSQVGRNNDMSLIPLADSYRSCMHCNVRFLCPSQHGLEKAKAEQRTLMCHNGISYAAALDNICNYHTWRFYAVTASEIRNKRFCLAETLDVSAPSGVLYYE